ncbi:phage tail protein, partial [Streptomyces laurentii]
MEGERIGLEFDSVLIRQITEVSGLKMEQDVIELKQN